MANHGSLAVLESALRARRLDRTLTSALPSLERIDAAALARTNVDALDACLHGGLPRGQLSEVIGPRSAGRTTLLLQMVAAATRRGEIAALIDTFDRLDVASAVAAGIDLDRLLWVRGTPLAKVDTGWGGTRTLRDRTLDRAVKALNLVLQAGGFGLVAIDKTDVPPLAMKQQPFTTWRRVQRIIEGSDTACVIAGAAPGARSAGGLTLTLGARTVWAGEADRSRRLDRLAITTRIVSPRHRVDGEVRVSAKSNDSR
jgi:hypothetical protein